jgi:hypothetical protein
MKRNSTFCVAAFETHFHRVEIFTTRNVIASTCFEKIFCGFSGKLPGVVLCCEATRREFEIFHLMEAIE